MNEYLQFKRGIQQRVDALESLIGQLEHHQAIEDSLTTRWRDQLTLVQAALQDNVVRVAVVGSVKSGKSTLINTLLGRDLLKRGAGITTAFITRIRTDGEIGGWVELKPWAQILEELNTTVRSLPIVAETLDSPEESPDQEEAGFDLRCKEDRDQLHAILQRVQTEWQHVKGRLHPDFLVLNGYLEGFKGLSSHMGDSVNRVLFDARTIDQHQRYVSSESQAVFVRDMEIHHPIDWLGERVEIADCQGSDSPNPLHLAHIQQYLLRSHFLLYVIHSRTGLREADFKLLDFVKTLRMDSQTFFVLNVDLDAHPDAEDVERLKGRVREELGWVVPNPRVFSFSGLFHLADQLGDAASPRETRRAELWSLTPSVIEASRAEYALFQDELAARIGAQRARVLMGTGLNRLTVVATGMLDSVRAQQRFFDRDLGPLKRSASILRNKHKVFLDTLNTLRHAIFGLRDSLRQEVDTIAREMFDSKQSGIIRETLDVIEHFDMQSRFEQDLCDPKQVFGALHRFYLEFRHSLSRFLVERVNLRLLAFAKQQEDFLLERLRKSSRAFWSLFSGALDDYRREMATFEIPVHAGVPDEPCEVTLHAAQSLPTLDAFFDHQAVSRGLLFLKFGLGRFTRFLADLRTRPGSPGSFLSKRIQGSHTVEEAVSLVKAEAKVELLRAFAFYKDAFITDHMFPMVDRATRGLLDGFTMRLEMARLDFAELVKHGEVEGEHRQERIRLLAIAAEMAESMIDELDELRCAVNLEWVPPQETASLEGASP
ncbi:MAG: dynamin family protein [Syntrophobacteraceae bacterium]